MNEVTAVIIRPRRLRRSAALRDLTRETRLHVDDLIYPIFLVDGENQRQPINSMPGIARYSLDRLPEELERVRAAGVRAVLFFSVPEHKDEFATEAYRDDATLQQAIRLTKRQYPDLVVIADICLCEFTDHGHCGIVRGGMIENDETLIYLAKMAVSCAAAGADIVAPSDMMDGHVSALRAGLDRAGFDHAIIMSYSTKFASSFYGPFREAADSTPQFGDRRSYQMDPANFREAIRETSLDIEEGADIVMVKPALAYLDVLHEIARTSSVPVAAYNVSGEYSMIKAAAERGWIDEQGVVMESLLSLKRAGADLIITYYALEAAGWLNVRGDGR